MIMTPSKTSIRQPASTGKPYPAWGDILRQVKAGDSSSQGLAPKSRDWRDLVADMIINKR